MPLWEVAGTLSPHPHSCFFCAGKNLELGLSLLPPNEDMHLCIQKHDPPCKAFGLFVSRHQINRQLKIATCESRALSFQVLKIKAEKSKVERTSKRRVTSSCDGSLMSSHLCWLLCLKWCLYFQHPIPYHCTTSIWVLGNWPTSLETCPM